MADGTDEDTDPGRSSAAEGDARHRGPEATAADVPAPGRSLLLIDSDEHFRAPLARGLAARGFDVRPVGGLDEARRAMEGDLPAYAVVDVSLRDGNGLELLGPLVDRRPDCRVVVLTAHGGIATAVAAIKRGAADYLTKPSDPATVAQALLAENGALPAPPPNPISADRARWEHVQRVLELNDRNVSETARRLGMHRRTLQRMLNKNAPR